MPYIPEGVAETPQSLLLARHHGPPRRGKVRDIYDLGQHLLIVTTDRVSSDDHVLGVTIENKGIVLNGLAVWWFAGALAGFPNHLEAAGPCIDDYLKPVVRGDADLQARSIIARKCVPEPIEFVVRGYLVGSGWKDYCKTGSVCGIPLPTGLIEGQKLDTPIFTPATKAETGHDMNISEAEAAEIVTGGMDTLLFLKQRAIAAYSKGVAVAEQRGIIIADTKFELDQHGRLLDEVLTPDSSRFWPRPAWEEKQRSGGGTPPSLDKQYLRDHLKQYGFAGLTDEQAGRIKLSEEVRDRLSMIYVELLMRMTGKHLPAFKQAFLGVTT